MASLEASETKTCIRSLLTSNPLRCTVHQLCNEFRESIGYNIPYKRLGFPSVEAYLRSIPDTVRVVGSGPSAEVEGVVTRKSAHINALVAKQKTDSIPGHKKKNLKTHKNQQPSNRANPRPKLTKQFSQLSLNNYEYKSRIPKTVQNNLRQLIMRFPEGITCNKLQHEYRKRFKEDLNYQQYRFRSLIEMCTDLTEIFHYIRDTTDDFILYDKNNAVPCLQQNEICENSKELNVDWSLGPQLMPPDVVQFLEEVPRFDFNNINIGDYLDINIGEIYDINRFWVFPKFGDLDMVEERLQISFHNDRNRYVIPELFLMEGLYCVVYYNHKYHRCIIADTLPGVASYVKVLFVDYGSVGKIPCKHVWYLPRQFAQVPCQAVQAQLSSIKPIDNQTTNKFKELITNAEIVAEVVSIDKEGLELEIYLANITNQENVFYINDALVEKGYAKYLIHTK